MHKDDEQSEYQTGPVCADGAHIIYAWARDAPQLKLPEGKWTGRKPTSRFL